MEQKKYNIYVIGSATSYARWIPGQLVNSMEDADVVVLTGGQDISPALYNEPAGSHTYFTDSRDRHELAEFKRAESLGKVVWGTCRGLQFLCAMAGGKLIQDMDHWNSHMLTMYDDSFSYQTNTLHHQMIWPYEMNKEDYHILAYAKGISKKYLDGNDRQMDMPDRDSNGVVKEPEFAYFPKIKGIGMQGHPEMMADNSMMVKVAIAYLNLAIENKLSDVLLLNIPPSEVLERSVGFEFTEEENQFLTQVKRKNSLEIA